MRAQRALREARVAVRASLLRVLFSLCVLMVKAERPGRLSEANAAAELSQDYKSGVMKTRFCLSQATSFASRMQSPGTRPVEKNS